MTVNISYVNLKHSIPKCCKDKRLLRSTKRGETLIFKAMEEYDESMMQELAEAEAEFVKTFGEYPSEFQFENDK